MKSTSRVAALLALTTLGSAASAQDMIATQNKPWKGFYTGGNIGGAWNHTCSSWEPGPTHHGQSGPCQHLLQSRLPQQWQFHWRYRSRLQLSISTSGFGV